MDKEILLQQKNEITEHFIYENLAKKTKDKKNKKILLKISKDELRHYNFWKNFSKKEVKPNKFKILYFSFLAKILGPIFTLKLMERGEENAQGFYEKMSKKYPGAMKIKSDEQKHEKELISMLNDSRLNYASSIVLGLNDALVELTGTLAGLSFAFTNTKIIGIVGLIMGLAASLSMTASGYLSSREEENGEKNPIKSAIFTGLAYIFTVIILTLPYFIFEEVIRSFLFMFLFGLVIIALYTFYISIAKEKSFFKRFIEMALISLSVAIISFGFGVLVKSYFGIKI